MRFAYLILAHNNFAQLRLLIKALDYPSNDIFVHLDKKLGNVDLSFFSNITDYSEVVFIEDRVDVAWARISIVEATFNLIKRAINGNYDYYHLLSGVDFPIKKNSYILNFFKEHSNDEFIGISQTFDEKMYLYRVGRYHWINGNKVRNSSFWRIVNSLLLFIQTKMNIYHYKKLDRFIGGPAWFSISKDLSIKLLKEKNIILKDFKYTQFPDELFLQTFILNTEYWDRLHNREDEYLSCMRKIDWSRGGPYTWKLDDYDELMSAPHLFARKIDYKLAEKLLTDLHDDIIIQM